MKTADFVFETSWEICNKVGGIYTVLSTKAKTAVQKFGDNYICIGPELSHDEHHEFVEAPLLFKNWHDKAELEGLRFRIGRWDIPGNPIAILIDFTTFFEKKNDILTELWLSNQLDSISGQWDYIEPALFGYAAGKVIESFYQFYCSASDKIIAHFHEWMTGAGILYLENKVPQIATLFTTHATVLGRCICGNGLPLYKNIAQYNPDEYAKSFNVQSKYSLERLSAHTADCFTTVSSITDNECAAFLKQAVDVVTINGFENNFVPQAEEYKQQRELARKKLKSVSEALTHQHISDNAFYIINSGRYEFKNKGIDIFIDSLAKLQALSFDRDVVAFITVPAGTTGYRTDLLKNMGNSEFDNPVREDYATHLLHDYHNDPIINYLKEKKLFNSPESKVKVIFVPVYLNGNDGIFNLDYYKLLVGFDLSIFPSYYEPWGYTPLESAAFGIPTITCSLAGFGAWVEQQFPKQESVTVIRRDDDNREMVSTEISEVIKKFIHLSDNEYINLKDGAKAIAHKALWENLYSNYIQAYEAALQKSASRYNLYKDKISHINIISNTIKTVEPHFIHVSVKSELPPILKKLEELAHNLCWSWNYEARELFIEIAGDELWQKYEENPTHIMQTLPLQRIIEFTNNQEFINKLNLVYSKFRNYIETPKVRPEKQIAYFSMEFGISNELKIFSGGLGMLAGDYLKEASDCNVNMIGVGLLYRQGYFTQQISNSGEQINIYTQQSFSKLPIKPIKDENGDWKMITITLPGRKMYARIWRVDVGRIPLYLLDTDFSLNQPQDRQVTYQLYGGDVENRLKQELLLGIGGVRMLQLLDIHPTLFHLNEGHSAFMTLERLLNTMTQEQIPLQAAIELVRASSLFTTHTPVPAGHDTFSEDLMRTYFANYSSRFNISWDSFMAMGRKSIDNTEDKFSMSILAAKLSQEMNGVSKIHGRVSQEMFAYLYEGFCANELYINYVTNGVHYPTWAHKRWQHFHEQLFGREFLADQSNPAIWEKIYEANDADLWQIKNDLRKELIDEVKKLLEIQMQQRSESPSLIVSTLKSIRNDILTVGFARRFATYKRAYLLFSNEDKLKAIVNNPMRPIQFIFAGKAHPNDKAGQDLIKKIIEFSRRPEFIGKIIFLENYDMILAKKLISGCDIWLNTPTRPLEASGTSGEKAIMNGVLNFSVLDGWWAEGYVPGAGWAINEEITYMENWMQNELDAATIYALFDEQIAPTFYHRNSEGIPIQWTEMMKNNFAKIAPRFTMKRQLDDYYNKFYHKLEERTLLLTDNHHHNAIQLIKWKTKIIDNFDNIEVISISHKNAYENTYSVGEKINIEVALKLGTLQPDDIKMEVCFINKSKGINTLFSKYPFQFTKQENGISYFGCALEPHYAGTWDCGIRLIPNNTLLPHDQDFNLAKWL